MKHHDLQKKLHGIWNRKCFSLLTLMVVFLTATVTTGHAEALYILTGADDTAIVLDGKTAVPDLSGQMVFVTTGGKGYDVTLAAKQTVTIRRDGTEQIVQSRKESISRLLSRIGIVPSPLETVAVDLSGPGVEITVEEEITYYDRVVEEVTFDTVRIANPEMKKGTEKVVQEGADGVRTCIYEVIFSNGRELCRQFVEEIDSTAVDQIVEYGTAEEQPAPIAVTTNNQSAIASVSKNGDGSGTLTLADGTTLNFSAAKSMTATAYTAGHGGADYCTATGTTVRVGTVAVDKSVIPLGTKMFIVTNDGIVYGTAVAEDTGVRGNKVDLYFDTYQQCINFGRRSCTVYILK